MTIEDAPIAFSTETLPIELESTPTGLFTGKHHKKCDWADWLWQAYLILRPYDSRLTWHRMRREIKEILQ